MNSLIWLDEYNIGHEEIDLQHQKLFELAENIIHSTSSQLAHNQLRLLCSYLDQHFKAEEALMEYYKMPSYAEHAKDHQRIMTHLMTLSKSIQNGYFNPNDIIGFMREWLAVHILEKDMFM